MGRYLMDEEIFCSLSAKSSLSKCLDYHTPIGVPENYGLNLIFAFRVNLIGRKNQSKQEIKGYQQKMEESTNLWEALY